MVKIEGKKIYGLQKAAANWQQVDGDRAFRCEIWFDPEDGKVKIMLSENVINNLLEMGGKRWIKGTMDRIYFNCSFLDCEFEYYKTGEATSTMIYLQESLQERLEQALQAEAVVNA